MKMGRKSKQVHKIAPRARVRTILVNATASILLLGAVGWIAFFYLNMGNSEKTFAAGSSYSSNRSGNWTTGSTWNGGTAPSTSLNGDDITIGATHSVTLTGNLNVQNNSAFIINGTLTINGNLTVQNNLTLTITGQLIVNGNITTQNGASITVNGGGTVTTSGNVTLGNNATINVNGTMNIGGNLTVGANPNFSGNGTVSVGGTGCSQWQGPGSCNDNTTLPIELISFAASNSPEGIMLTWKTASELNNDHFSIERSTDGLTYSIVATVQGSGTTKKMMSYDYLDANSLNGRLYYRLSQTDFDGKSETFKPVSVEIIASAKSTIKVYPNPMTGNVIHIDFSKPEQGVIEVIDNRGHRVISESVDGSLSSVQFDLNTNLQPGLYYLNYKTATTTETIKLIKQD